MVVCPKGCGRAFFYDKYLDVHLPNCDGQPREWADIAMTRGLVLHCLCLRGCGMWLVPENAVRHEEHCGERALKAFNKVQEPLDPFWIRESDKQREIDEQQQAKKLKDAKRKKRGPYRKNEKVAAAKDTAEQKRSRLRVNSSYTPCLKGCGQVIHISFIARHEFQCKASFARLDANPKAQYATYLDFCIAFKLLTTGESGILPAGLTLSDTLSLDEDTSEEMVEHLSMYDIKAEEVDDDAVESDTDAMEVKDAMRGCDDGSQQIDIDMMEVEDAMQANDDECQESDTDWMETENAIEANDNEPQQNDMNTMEAGETMHKRAKSAVEETNRRLLKNIGLSESDIPAPDTPSCAGVYWRHGSYACPNSAILSIKNTPLYQKTGRNGAVINSVGWGNRCHKCRSMVHSLDIWVNMSRFSESGERLCSSKTCTKLAMFSASTCHEHRQNVMKSVERAKGTSNFQESKKTKNNKLSYSHTSYPMGGTHR